MDALEKLRGEMREVTVEIMKYVKKRMEIAKEIGGIKNKKGLDIVDENTEDELRKSILQVCSQIGLETDVGMRLLNVLLNESERVQLKRKTPMTIFAKAKELESKGKKIIHLDVGEPDFMPPISLAISILFLTYFIISTVTSLISPLSFSSASIRPTS